MTRKLKTRNVQKSLYVNYLKKADECCHAAQSSFEGGEWNASAVNAVHCCICACDAMCVYFLGKRSSGDDHNDVVVLFKAVKNDEDIKVNTSRLLRVLRMKNIAEYEERLINQSEAEKILKDAERLLGYIKG